MFDPPFYDIIFFLIPLFSQLFLLDPPRFHQPSLWAKNENSTSLNTIEEEKNDPADPARGHGFDRSRKEAQKENDISQWVTTVHKRQRVQTHNFALLSGLLFSNQKFSF